MSSSLEEFPNLRIPFEQVASATNRFADANLIGQGSVGKVYLGQLHLNQQWVNIAARRFSEEGHDFEFWREISILSDLRHANMVSIVGFCDENGEKVIITERSVQGGLDRYLSSPTLTWMQRLQVCLGAARALSYLHSDTDRGYGVIHRNIKSCKILLDKNWEAKLCGFGLSVSYPANRRHRLLFSEPCGTLGYTDPLCLATRSVTHKSDVYSFGVVLFEVLCGREVKIMDGGGCRFPQYYESRKLDELIDPILRTQMDPQSMSVFSDTAYHCLNKQRTQRPDMEKVVKRLEQALDLQWKLETQVEGTSSIYHLKGENLEHLKIQLSDIKEATKNFTETCIGSGTKVYIDPEYSKTGELRKESDTYSFGVVLFEIMCGSLAYDETYNVGNDGSFPAIVRRRFNEGTLKEMIDPKIKDETDVNIYTLNRGPNQDSWDAYSKIGYRCLAETHAQRPTMDVVIKKLEKALHFQENNIDSLKFSLQDIKLATRNFSCKHLIGKGGFGNVYKGKISHANGHNLIVAKRLDIIHGQGEDQFLTELEILFEYKHENVIGLVGYCNEMDEKIIVYEYASRGSLDKYLKDSCLTWTKRLEICIDVATALEFLHKEEAAVIHRDIKSSNILLDEDWKAMIGDFGLSLICPINQEKDHVIVNPAGTPGYFDPLLIRSGFLTKQSDIYSLGVVLLEILCGRFVVENYADKNQYLDALVKTKINEGREEEMEFESIEEMVFGGITKQIGRASFTTYCQIAHQCIFDDRKKRPTTSEVIIQLHKALELQEKYEKSKLVTHTYEDVFDFTGQF